MTKQLLTAVLLQIVGLGHNLVSDLQSTTYSFRRFTH